MIVTLGGKSIFYEIEGSGRPIVLIHGWGGSSESLKQLAFHLSKNFQTIRVDLPGFGQSDNPDPAWGIEEYAKIIVDLIIKLGFKKVYYFGHSFGANLGIYLANSNSEMINKLIICASSFKRTGKSSIVAKKLQKLFQIPRPLKYLAYRIFFPKSDLYKLPQLETNFRKIVVEDLTESLPKITQPTLILWGKKDTYTLVENAYLAAKLIKNSKLKVFNEFGHGLPLYQPELISYEITKFLNQ